MDPNTAAITCPITGNIMTDPVMIVESGQTYQRSDILEWFKECRNNNKTLTDPITGKVLINSTLVENWAIRSLISSAGHPLVNQQMPNAPRVMTNQAVISEKYFKTNGQIYKRLEVTNDSTLPLTLIAVIDISGSMANPSSEQEGSSFYSRMTLVKLVLKVLVNMCLPNTKLGLVTFTDIAKVIFSPKLMTDQNKKEACTRIDTMHPTSGTNISTGLEKSFELANMETETNRNICAMVLTDGEPSEPIERIKQMLNVRPEFLTIYTVAFGFGNGLNSNLMYEMAMNTGGSYTYIPDASCVADAFVCLMANLLMVSSQKNQLQSNIPKDIIHIGPSPTAQSILDMDEDGIFHTKLVDSLNRAFILAKTTRVDQGIKLLIELVDEYKPLYLHTRIQETLDDIVHPDSNKGQIVKALQNWTKWGQHYFPAVLSAHTNCIQANLKDASMKWYSNEITKQMIEHGVKIYESLPPPGADFQTNRNIGSDTLRQISQTPCFGTGTLVKMADGSLIKIEDIKKGNKLYDNYTVVCVVKSLTGKHNILAIDDITITPYHPIVKIGEGNNWIYPINYEEIKSIDKVDVVYNLVLDKGHKIMLGSKSLIVSCTLGHGIKKPVVEHPYLGTGKVIDDLEMINGWYLGKVTITKVERDPKTGMICRFS